MVARVLFRAVVALRAEVASAQESAVCLGRVEINLCLCVSNVCAESLQCQFGNEGICSSGFDKAWLGVFLSQDSPCYTAEI